MDNIDNVNNIPAFPEDGFTYPARDGGASVQDSAERNQDDINSQARDRETNTQGQQPVFSQGKYPQPPEWTKNIVISDKPWIPTEENGNVSVQFNDPEKVSEQPVQSGTAEEFTEPKRELPMWMQLGIVAFAALLVFLLLRYVSQIRNPSDETIGVDVNAVTVVPTMGTTAPVTVPSTAPPMTSAPDTSTTVRDTDTTEKNKEEEKTTAGNKKPSSQATESKTDEKEAKIKVIEYFNESSNRVKTEAVKVVRNFENRTHNEDKLELPAALKGVGKSLLKNRIAGTTEPLEYATPEEIVSRYPAPGQEWSSILTEEEVEEAICVENGDEYEITLKLYDCVDPEQGKGTSKAMDCLDVPTVRDTAPPFITAFSAEYYDCVIRCRVNKETGRVVWANYTAPVVIRLGLDAGIAQFDAQIGITFEKDYSIEY